MDRKEKEMQEESLLEEKNKQIMQLRAALSSKNNQILNLQFCLKLRDDQLKQMHRAFVENQKQKAVFMTKLQLTSKKLQTTSSTHQKLNQRLSKVKVSSGLEITHLRSLLKAKDSELDSLNNKREELVRRSEENTKTKIEVKSTLLLKTEVKRKEDLRLVERCLPEGADYEDLLVKMEEGLLCDQLKPIDDRRMKVKQQTEIIKESPITTFLKVSPKIVILEESPKIGLAESPAKVPEVHASEVDNDGKPNQEKNAKEQKPLTMEDVGVFGVKKETSSSYEESLTMEELGLFGDDNADDESKKLSDATENDRHVIDLLIRMEEGLLHSQF